MGNIFNSIFGSKKEESAEEQAEKKFEILKQDGIRAINLRKVNYGLSCLLEALAIKKDLQIYHTFVSIYFDLNQLEEAEKYAQEIIDNFPENKNKHLPLLEIKYTKEEYDEIISYTNEVLAKEGKNENILLIQAKTYNKQNQQILAIASLTQAIAIKEDFYDALFLRGEILLEMNQYKEAEEDINKAYSINPTEDCQVLKGQVFEKRGDLDQALEIFTTLKNDNPFLEEAYLSIGRILIHQKKVEEAIKCYTEGIEIINNFAEGYKARGQAKLINGDKEGSVNDMKKALEISPDNIEKINGQFINREEKIDSMDTGANPLAGFIK